VGEKEDAERFPHRPIKGIAVSRRGLRTTFSSADKRLEVVQRDAVRRNLPSYNPRDGGLTGGKMTGVTTLG